VVRYNRFREPCSIDSIEPAACQTAIVTSMLRIGAKSYAIEKKLIRSHMKDSLCAWNQEEGAPGRKYMQALMEVTISQEWAKVEKTKGMVTTSSRLLQLWQA
jgi:hypothetical protein